VTADLASPSLLADVLTDDWPFFLHSQKGLPALVRSGRGTGHDVRRSGMIWSGQSFLARMPDCALA
jgi:hypothetical protein